MGVGNHNIASELLKKYEFADFAYSFYLLTLHKAYGSISGTEASDRLLKESIGLTSTGKDRVRMCGAHPPFHLSKLEESHDLQKEILKGAMKLHFVHASNETTERATNASWKENLQNMTFFGRACYFLRWASPYQLATQLVTISMTDNGGMIITFHLSERKQVWLFRVFRTAVLSLVMSRGNLRSSKLLFCLFSTAWAVQKIVRFMTKRWLSLTLTVDPSKSDAHKDIDREETLPSAAHSSEISEGSFSYFVRRSIFFLASFCISMNPNYKT